jgi:two-component system sensor histidine kinase MtrB
MTTHPGVPRRMDWGAARRLPSRLVHVWRTSLRFRTVLITVALTGIAILVTGVVVSFSISNDLYQSRLDQAFGDSARATTDAQKKLDAADATDPAAVQSLFQQVLGDVKNSTSTNLIQSSRVPGQGAAAGAPTGITTFGSAQSVISDELKAKVRSSDHAIYAQSVALPAPDGSTDPGIVVGTELVLPNAGRYELYLGYRLHDSEQTLLFVQRTLLLAGLALVLLIGTTTNRTTTQVIAPISSTSERPASSRVRCTKSSVCSESCSR